MDEPNGVEALHLEAKSIIEEAREIASWPSNFVIKILITAQGLESTSVLSKEKIKFNLPLYFLANQALLSALAGAAFVRPFMGRLDNIGHDRIQLIDDTANIYKWYNYKIQVISVSIRKPLHCIVAVKAGADTLTVPYKVLIQMINHPLTDAGITCLLEDWQKNN